eukprot:g6654.t1
MSLLEIHTSAFGDGGHCQEDYPVSDLFHYAYDDPAKWLRAHNYYRACHGAPPLVWNESLVAASKEWAETLVRRCQGVRDTYHWVQHDGGRTSPGRPHDPYCFTELPGMGENILTQEAAVMNLGVEAHAVETWYREVETQCHAQGQTHGCGRVYNHYTTMMWKSMRQVGCYTVARYVSRNRTSVPAEQLRAEADAKADAKAEGEAGKAPLTSRALVYRVPVCRYIADPVQYPDGGDDCILTNVDGCGREMVPSILPAVRSRRGQCRPYWQLVEEGDDHEEEEAKEDGGDGGEKNSSGAGGERDRGSRASVDAPLPPSSSSSPSPSCERYILDTLEDRCATKALRMGATAMRRLDGVGGGHGNEKEVGEEGGSAEGNAAGHSSTSSSGSSSDDDRAAVVCAAFRSGGDGCDEQWTALWRDHIRPRRCARERATIGAPLLKQMKASSGKTLFDSVVDLGRTFASICLADAGEEETKEAEQQAEAVAAKAKIARATVKPSGGAVKLKPAIPPGLGKLPFVVQQAKISVQDFDAVTGKALVGPPGSATNCGAEPGGRVDCTASGSIRGAQCVWGGTACRCQSTDPVSRCTVAGAHKKYAWCAPGAPCVAGAGSYGELWGQDGKDDVWEEAASQSSLEVRFAETTSLRFEVGISLQGKSSSSSGGGGGSATSTRSPADVAADDAAADFVAAILAQEMGVPMARPGGGGTAGDGGKNKSSYNSGDGGTNESHRGGVVAHPLLTAVAIELDLLDEDLRLTEVRSPTSNKAPPEQLLEGSSTNRATNGPSWGEYRFGFPWSGSSSVVSLTIESVLPLTKEAASFATSRLGALRGSNNNSTGDGAAGTVASAKAVVAFRAKLVKELQAALQQHADDDEGYDDSYVEGPHGYDQGQDEGRSGDHHRDETEVAGAARTFARYRAQARSLLEALRPADVVLGAVEAVETVTPAEIVPA